MSRKDRLIAEGRKYCYYVPVTSYVAGKGFRPSIVFESEEGHYPNGGGDTEPWYWGEDYEEARRICDEKNAAMGISKAEEYGIVMSSIGQSLKLRAS
ncbi:MAG: hypothetical protein V1799_07525 [bacterium]